MPSFMKDELKKKDEQKLDEMQQEIDQAAMAEEEADAEDAKEAEDAGADEEASSADEAQQQVEKLEAELKEQTDRALRLQADFENFRRRTSKEKEELAAVVTQGILKDMLPLLDNFERAMAAEAKDGEAFQKGVEMIFTQFGEVLKKNGLEKIETEGQKFDPNFHQAVMRVQNEELEDDDIAQELQKGYMVKGWVIRPSMVQVVAN
ncbi:molecular chaperone GrpE [Selenomonas sp. GACV-9]|nr:molecular chaperone GrpE [Selenomonas ruminantium]